MRLRTSCLHTNVFFTKKDDITRLSAHCFFRFLVYSSVLCNYLRPTGLGLERAGPNGRVGHCKTQLLLCFYVFWIYISDTHEQGRVQTLAIFLV
jgi:hypothetical protein